MRDNITISTRQREELVDITAQVNSVVQASGVRHKWDRIHDAYL